MMQNLLIPPSETPAAATPPLRRTMLVGVHKRFWHLAIVAGIGYILLIVFIFSVHPSNIAHVLLPNSYLPFLALFFSAQAPTWIFLLRHSRRGAVVALYCTLLLFLQLHQVLTPQLVVGMAIPFGLFELVATRICLI